MTLQEISDIVSLIAGILPVWDVLWFNVATWFNYKNMEIAAEYE